MPSDAELVEAVFRGEESAFTELVRRYERAVRAAGLGVLRDYHAAEDAAQEAFVKAYAKLGGLRKTTAFGPWVLKIARRCALDAAQQKSKQAVPASPINMAGESGDGQLDGDKQQLLAAMLRLPRVEKEVVMLRYFAGNSVRDVASMAGRSVGTVTKQLSRAHRRLRKILSQVEA